MKFYVYFACVFRLLLFVLDYILYCDWRVFYAQGVFYCLIYFLPVFKSDNFCFSFGCILNWMSREREAKWFADYRIRDISMTSGSGRIFMVIFSSRFPVSCQWWWMSNIVCVLLSRVCMNCFICWIRHWTWNSWCLLICNIWVQYDFSSAFVLPYTNELTVWFKIVWKNAMRHKIWAWE